MKCIVITHGLSPFACTSYMEIIKNAVTEQGAFFTLGLDHFDKKKKKKGAASATGNTTPLLVFLPDVPPGTAQATHPAASHVKYTCSLTDSN